MPKNRPTDGAKGRPRKAKMHTRTAKEAVQRMFSPVGTADTTMTETNTEEEESEAMQDVSENASDMETDEQKKRERAPKQNTQETTTVTSDTASPEPCRQEDLLPSTTDARSPKAHEAATSAQHKHTATTPHASRKHDAGHIHRASPIRGLPPEQSCQPIFLNAKTKPVLLGQESTVTARKQDVSSEYPPRPQRQAIQATRDTMTSLHFRKSSRGLSSCLNTLVENIILAQNPPFKPAPPKLPDAREEPGKAMPVIDARMAYHDRLMPTTPLSGQDITNKADLSSSTPTPRSMNQNGRHSPARQPVGKPLTQETHKFDKKEVTLADGQATRSRFAWKKGFLGIHKPPTRRPLPWSTPYPHTNSTNMSTHKKEPASVVSGDKEQNADFYRTTHRTVSSIPVPQMARPSESILPPPLPTEKLSTCLQRYDLRLCLYGKNGEVYSEWEAVTSFLRRLQAIDDSIQLLPWQVGPDCGNKPPLAISQSTQFLFDLHTYVPRLSTETSLRTRIKLGHTRHPYLFLSSSVQPGTLVDKMGPWLRATKQGM